MVPTALDFACQDWPCRELSTAAALNLRCIHATYRAPASTVSKRERGVSMCPMPKLSKGHRCQWRFLDRSRGDHFGATTWPSRREVLSDRPLWQCVGFRLRKHRSSAGKRHHPTHGPCTCNYLACFSPTMPESSKTLLQTCAQHLKSAFVTCPQGLSIQDSEFKDAKVTLATERGSVQCKARCSFVANLDWRWKMTSCVSSASKPGYQLDHLLCMHTASSLKFHRWRSWSSMAGLSCNTLDARHQATPVQPIL